MRLAIIGSRGIFKADIAKLIPAEFRTKLTEIISGGAQGVDTLAAEYAEKAGLKMTVFTPDYKRFKGGATFARNTRIAQACDALLAIHDGESRGTLYTVEAARRENKPVHVVTMKARVHPIYDSALVV